MTLFVDLDGVLADFLRAACDLHRPGSDQDEIMAYGRELLPNGHPFDQLEAGLGVSKQTFWREINAAGTLFWSQMQPFRWTKELWRRLNEITNDIAILTSPAQGLGASYAAAGKLQWVYHHLGEDVPYKTIVCPAPLKHQMAAGNVLLDDYDQNILRWEAVGGEAIRFPSLQFDHRQPTAEEIDETIRKVHKLISLDDLVAKG